MFDLRPTPYDLSFRLLGFPVRVHPFFWLIIALLGARGQIDNLSLWLLDLVIWTAAAFLAILIHELGHALVFRHVYGVNSRILFYGLGGLTIPSAPHRRKYGFYGMLCEVFLSFAGPLAGFLLAGILIVAFALAGASEVGWLRSFQLSAGGFVGFSTEFLFMVGRVGAMDVKYYLVFFLYQLGFVSIVWGVFNLLPIHPMDGGQVTREIFCYFSPRHGTANSLGLSIVVALAVGFLALNAGMMFVTILFAFFAYQNYQELSSRSFRSR